MQEAIAAVMVHCSLIAQPLVESPEEHGPVLGMDTDSVEVFWQPWIGSFERGMGLCRGVWQQIALSRDSEAAAGST